MLEKEKPGGNGMPIDKRVKSAAEALEGVADGATVFITGFGGAGFPNQLIHALRERGPKNLTLVVNSATHRYSLTHELIANDQVRKVICTAARGQDKEPSPFETRWMENKIELEMVPQGSFTERIRAGGAGIPAFYTPVGFGTELAEGKEVRRFGDRDYVLEHAISGDLALVRADTADRTGNLIFRYAQMNFGPVMATAAKLAVAEVREIANDLLPHERVQLPGMYVDRVVAVA
jgi:3-oxoadipate CoA-transferase alpha subunit